MWIVKKTIEKLNATNATLPQKHFNFWLVRQNATHDTTLMGRKEKYTLLTRRLKTEVIHILNLMSGHVTYDKLIPLFLLVG